MPTRKKKNDSGSEDTGENPKLFNVSGKGLGFYDKKKKLTIVADVSLKLVGRYS